MTNQEWFSEKISKLIQDNLRMEILTELRDQLEVLSREDGKRIFNSLNLSELFDCLNDSNEEETELVCQVISLCFNNLNLGESITKYCNGLEKALIHSNGKVKLVALKEINRCIVNEEVLLGLCDNSIILQNVIMCLKDDDLEIVTQASHILECFGSTVSGVTQFYKEDRLNLINELLQEKPLIKLRVYKLIISISNNSSYSFKKFQEDGLIHRILDDLSSGDDILFKLNIIELLSNLSQSEHGFAFLDESGVINILFKLMETDALFCQLCQKGVIEFFGFLAHKQPFKIIQKYSTETDTILNIIKGNNSNAVSTGIYIIGHIGTAEKGKIALNYLGIQMEQFIEILGQRFSSPINTLKIEVLECMADLLKRTDNSDETLSITIEWYKKFSSIVALPKLLECMNFPFPDVHLAILCYLQTLASYEWGVRAIKNTPGMLEYLINRDISTPKENKELKYNVVKLLAASSVIFSTYFTEKIKNYVHEGPFYVDAVTQIDYGGN